MARARSAVAAALLAGASCAAGQKDANTIVYATFGDWGWGLVGTYQGYHCSLVEVSSPRLWHSRGTHPLRVSLQVPTTPS